MFYFLPTDKPSITKADVEEAGFGYAVQSAGREVLVGPESRRGFVFNSDKSQLGYYNASEQVWVPAPKLGADSPPYWVGYPKGEKFDPEHFARPEQIDGEPITMMDGSRWMVPRLILWHEDDQRPAVYSVNLPQSIDIDDEGNPVPGTVVRKYRDLFDDGMKILAALTGRGDEAISSGAAMKFAANVLGVNYKVSLLELSSKVLDCMSTSNAYDIIRIAVDLKGYNDAVGNWVGRATPADTASGSGSPAETNVTNQPLES